jgi:hypothetical protein
MFALREYPPSELDGIPKSFDSRHGPRLQTRAIHDDGIQLRLPFPIQVRADPRVKHRVIFHKKNRMFTRVKRGTSSLQNCPSGCQRLLDAGLSSLLHFCPQRARSTMNRKRKRMHRRSIVWTAMPAFFQGVL